MKEVHNMYRVELDHWKNGSGYTHSELFDYREEYCTAEEYFDNMVASPLLPFDDAITIRIFDDTNIELSEYTVNKEE